MLPANWFLACYSYYYLSPKPNTTKTAILSTGSRTGFVVVCPQFCCFLSGFFLIWLSDWHFGLLKKVDNLAPKLAFVGCAPNTKWTPHTTNNNNNNNSALSKTGRWVSRLIESGSSTLKTWSNLPRVGNWKFLLRLINSDPPNFAAGIFGRVPLELD